MRLRAAFDGYDASDATLIAPLTIRQDSSEAISTCELTIFQGQGVARYDQSRYGQATYQGWSPQEWNEVVIWDQDTAQIMFAGYVLAIARAIEGPYVRYELQCSDWAIILERRLITQSWPAGTPDSTVVADLLSVVPELTEGMIVTQIGDLGALEYKDSRVRDVLDDVCALTGSEWNVSYDGRLNYYRQGSILPPFGLSDRPDGVTTMPYQIEDIGSDFADAANRVTVLGAVTDTGEIRAVADHAASQTQYGLLSITLVDRNLSDPATAQLWALTEVNTRSFPKPTYTVVVWEPGLTRGMTVPIEAVKYGIDRDMILRSLEIVIAAPDPARVPVTGHVLKYTATLGWRPPDMTYTLRRMQRKPVQSTKAPSVGVPPGSIGPGDFVEGIAPVYIVAGKPTDWSPYPADAVFFNTLDRKLYRRIAGDDWTAVVDAAEIEGQLQTDQLAPGSVTTTVLADGSVVTAKIPAGAIQEPQIAASAVTANAIAANAVYAEAVQANAIRSIHLIANAVVAGKIAALAVVAGNIAADAVTAGTIAAAAVVAGNVAANAIAANNIQAGAITADKIQAGSIDSSKLNAVEIAVGYGSNKPGRIAVYDTAFNLVALVGDLSGVGGTPIGVYGGWFKRGAFGGTGYSDSRVYTDNSGNLFIRQADFQIDGPGGTVLRTSPANFDTTYSTVALTSTLGGDQTSFVSRGLIVYSGGHQCGAINRAPGGAWGEMTLRNSSGTLSVIVDGNAGTVRADGGFTTAGYAGIGTPPSAGTYIDFLSLGGAPWRMYVRGGIITAVVPA